MARVELLVALGPCLLLAENWKLIDWETEKRVKTRLERDKEKPLSVVFSQHPKGAVPKI
jgi:hypothetical protein